MAKIRDVQSSADYGRVLVDEQLQDLEARLTDLYAKTSHEMKKDLDKFLDKFQENDKKKREQLERGEITKSEYTDWRNRTIFRTEAMTAKVNDLTQQMLNTDKTAIKMVNDQLPDVYATAWNFGGYRGETYAQAAGYDYTQFTIVNRDAVRVLATKDPDLIPWKPSVDVEEDKKWNRTHLQTAIMQGIVKGDSIPELADRLMPVVNSDRSAAIRTARTAVNGIENKGRKDATDRVREAGIPMEEKWSCTHDNRTRETHILLDGTLPNEDGLYGTGIIDTLLEYPADPAGDPEEVYNCRCSIVSTIKGIDHSKDDELYAAMMEEEYYEEWLSVKEQREEKETQFQEKRAIALENFAAKPYIKEPDYKEEKPDLSKFGLKETTDIDTEKFNFIDGRFGKYSYELAREMEEYADEDMLLLTIEEGKNVAYAAVDPETNSLEGIVSTGGGQGTELLGRIMEYQESQGEGLMWLADNPESIAYYDHLGLGEYGKGDKNEKLYEISAEEMSEALEKINEHRDIPERTEEEELPMGSVYDRAISFLPDDLKDNPHAIEYLESVIENDYGKANDAVKYLKGSDFKQIFDAVNKANEETPTDVTEQAVNNETKKSEENKEMEKETKNPENNEEIKKTEESELPVETFETKTFESARDATEYFRGSTYDSNIGTMGKAQGFRVREEDNKPATKWQNKLTYDQTVAVTDYTGNSYEPVNNFLRGVWDKKEAGDNMTGHYTVDKTIKLLDGAIKKYDLKENITVYRTCEREFADRLIEGQTFHDEGYGSTTVVKDNIVASGDVFIEIDVPAMKGVGAYVDGLSWKEGEEFEFLLGRGADYYVAERRETEEGIFIKAIITGFTK